MFSIAPRRRPDPEPRVTITDAVLQHHQDQQHPASRLSAVRPSHITGRSRQRVVGLVPHVTSFARPPIPSGHCAWRTHRHVRRARTARPASRHHLPTIQPCKPQHHTLRQGRAPTKRARTAGAVDELLYQTRTLTTHNLSVLGAPLLGRVTPCQRVYIMLSASLPPSVASVGLFLPGWCARAVR